LYNLKVINSNNAYLSSIKYYIWNFDHRGLDVGAELIFFRAGLIFLNRVLFSFKVSYFSFKVVYSVLEVFYFISESVYSVFEVPDYRLFPDHFHTSLESVLYPVRKSTTF